MDIDLKDDGIEIEEYPLGELQMRISSKNKTTSKFRLKPASSHPRPDFRTTTDSGTMTSRTEGHGSSTTAHTTDIDILADSELEDGPDAMDIVEDEPDIVSVNSEQWPGHLMDVRMPFNETDLYSPSREGYLISELFNQLIFMWGLSPMPISSLEMSLKSELDDFSSPTENIDILDSIQTSSDSNGDESIDHMSFNSSGGARGIKEVIIEEYSENTKPNKKLSFSRNENDESDELPKKPRAQMYRIQTALKYVESYATQLDKLRFLIWHDFHRSLPNNGLYLSHILLLVGPSASVARQGCCIARSPRGNGLSISKSISNTIPPKSRMDDSVIRSTLREMLKNPVDAPSAHRQFSKNQAKLHLLVCWSHLPYFPVTTVENISEVSDLAFSRVSSATFTKWNPKRPIQTIRILSDPLTFPTLSSPPSITGKLGEYVLLL